MHKPIENFTIQVTPSENLPDNLRREILSLCNRAYEEDMEALFETFLNATHVLGYSDNQLVCHALWVTRFLQAGDHPPLQTAYVEAVATEARYRKRGFASAVMAHLAGAIQDYELAALSPFSVDYYQRLGWELWRGPLFIRQDSSLLHTPDEEVMIYRLPQTPMLNLNDPLSAEWRAGELW